MSRLCKQSLRLTLSAAIVLSLPVAHAQNYDGYPEWDAAPQVENFGPESYPWQPPVEQNTPADLLRDGVQKLTRFLDGQPNRRNLTAYLDTQVAPWFDFDYMAASAAGRHARFMSNAERRELVGRIKTSFLEKMAQKLAGYTRQRASFLPAEPDGYGQVTLPVIIENPGGGYPAQLEFVMRQTGKNWKVVDVAANGLSALMYYRDMFNDMMRQRPPGRY